MRYLRRQVLNPKSQTDSSVAVSISGEIVFNRPYTMLIPKGTTAQRSPDTTAPSYTNGMIRYNTETQEFEGYQAGSWRSFRFKEPAGVILQDLGIGDDVETIFGPLNPDPFAYTAQSGVSWDATQMAKNLVVVVENVYQIGTVNFDVVQNPTGFAAGTYLQFGTPVPINKNVYVFHKFDQ